MKNSMKWRTYVLNASCIRNQIAVFPPLVCSVSLSHFQRNKKALRTTKRGGMCHCDLLVVTLTK